MVDTSYANAYKEALVVINNLVKQDYDKIPKAYIEFLQANCNNNYNFEYNEAKSFMEQNLLEDTKYILFGLFEKFGATETQKTKIKSFKNKYYSKLENEKRKEYNPDNIFENRKTTVATNIDTTLKETAIVEYKEKNIIQKLFEKIKHIFRR